MNKVFYLVFVSFRGAIDYGMDEETYLVGVYLTAEKAEEAVKKFSKSIEPLAPDFYFGDHFGDIRLDHIAANEIEEDEKERYKPVRYLDGHYDIVQFDGRPIFVTGSSYME